MLAEITLYPGGGIIAWLAIGLIAGWLAGVAMKGGGFGILGDIVVGLIGACIGGALFGVVAQGWVGFWGSIVVAFIGSCILIGLIRLLVPGGRAHV